jgi:HK97 family phage portal protein
MIVDSRGRTEIRTAEFGSSAIPLPGYGLSVTSGVNYTPERALGLSAVGAAVRLIATMLASLDLCIFTGLGADKRASETSWQDVLLDNPSPDQTQFDLLSDVATGVEASGNSVVLKVFGQSRKVLALIPLDTDYLKIFRDPVTKEKVIEITSQGRTQRLSNSEVIHFRGWTAPGQVAGVSPIALHRQALGNAVALEEFEGRFYRQNGSPGGAIKVPGALKTARALEIRDTWDATHAGVANSHRTGVLTNGAEWQQIGISLQDAQFVESQRYGVEQVARIYGIAPEMLGHPLTKPEANEQLALRFLTFTLLSRMRRIEQTFAADPDLFLGLPQYPEFVIDDLLRTDAATQATVEHMQIQDGTKLVDEIRAEHGDPPLPPVPDDWTQAPGKVPQITPVGGAPNPAASTDDSATSATGSANPAGTVPVPKSSLVLNGDRRTT